MLLMILVISEEKCIFLGRIILQLLGIEVLKFSSFYSELVRFFFLEVYQLLRAFEWRCLKGQEFFF